MNYYKFDNAKNHFFIKDINVNENVNFNERYLICSKCGIKCFKSFRNNGYLCFYNEQDIFLCEEFMIKNILE